MATQAGKVQSIENGKFLVKDHNGNIKELKVGDVVFENDTVYGDILNSNSSKIEILLDGNDVIVLMQGQKQLIDSSLIETAFGNEELFFTRESMEQVLDAHNEIANVWSDLRDADFDDVIDITEEETTAGEEEEEVTEGSIGTFASRNGDIVDVISDLRKKSWVKTQTYKEVEKGDDYDKLNSKPLGNTTPIVTIPIDRPTSTPIENVTPPIVTPIPTPVVPVIPEEPLPLVTLGVDDVTVYESEGFLIFTVTIDQPTRENISFNYKTSQNTAENGKDYRDVEGNITIPSGSTSVQIKVPVVDDYLSDNGENMKITISNPIGNVVVSKPEGVGTILDNPPANNNPLDPNKSDSETGTYGEEDTVFVVITGDKTVNEGDKANYTVQIIDRDGNPVFVTKDTKVTVVYKNISTSNDDTEYKDGEYIKKDIIIKAGTSKSEIFDVETKDDYLADNGENFKLEITQVETTNEFENIVIGDKNGNQKDITTTILDDSKPTNYNPENPNNPTPSYPDPNKPNDGKIEKNQEQVILKIVAVDETGSPIMDGNKYTFVNSVNEGSNAKYMVLAFEPNTTEFTTQTVLSPSLQSGTVTIKTADDTALTTGTKDDAKLDYESTQKTVTLGQVFEVKTLDDYISDNGEKYKVSIIDSSYTHPSTPIYENVKIDPNPVITTIYDNSNPNNGTPHNPNDPTNHNQESDKDIVLIKLFAADKDGNVIKDTNGNYVLANRFAEGTEAKYIAYAFKDGETVFNDNTRLQTQTGTVDIEFHNGTATGSQTGDNTDTTGNKDFNNTSKSNISLGVTFGTDIFKDDMPEGEEHYTVTIDSNSYKGDYESVKIDPNPVTTTIYDKVDTIYAIIEGDIIVNEGDTASYTVKFIDKYGNEVEVEADTKVKVKFNHNNTNPTQNEDTQYNNDDEFEITIKAGKSKSEPFTVQTNDDVYKDDGEKYKLTITEIENTHGYTASNIGDKDGNKKDIVTEIKDNTNSGTETDIDPVKIVLVALEKGQTLADITDTDGKLIYKNTNTTPESGELSYIAVAVDSEDKVLVQSGKVTVNTANGTAIGGTSQTPPLNGSEDYKSLVNQSVNIGEVFKVKTNDDYVRDNDETFTVKITDPINTNYESPSIDTTQDTVTSTITDNPATVEQPDTSIGEDNPTTGSYGKEDTVYVKITKTPSTVEGGNLVHTITLVDKNGDLVTVPAGQTVTVNLTYSAKSGDFTEDDLSTIVKSVTITGGKSSENFTNITKDDFTYEGDEVYNVTISSVTQSGAFENVVMGDKDGNYKSTTGTIKDGVTIYKDGAYIDPENAIVDEDRFDVTNHNSKISNEDGNASDGTNTYQGQYLNIIKPNTDNNYSLIFDGNPTVYKGDKDSGVAFNYEDSRGTSLQSGGQVIHYQTIGNKIIGYVGSYVGNNEVAQANKVFEITLNKDSSLQTGANPNKITKDNYTYTQYKNIDHPVAGASTDSINDDNITFEFGFKITDQGSTSDVVKFKVTVNDSLPKTSGWTEEVNEDESVKIVISPESFAGGYIEIANGTINGGELVYYKLGKTTSGDIVTNVDIFDPNNLNKKVGELTTEGDGTVLFTPSIDYSNYDYTKNPSFSYKVSDFDGDTAGAKVEIKVKPVADAPTITFDTTKGTMSGNTFLVTTKEDNENNNEGSHKVDLGLKVPALSKDQTDLDSGKGDNPERNGEITLTFTNGDKLTGAKIFNGSSEVANITTANQEIKVVIVKTSGQENIDTTYHHSGTLPAKGGNVLYLTKSEYESLKIQHAEDNDTDIKITIKVTSYEVDDSGIPLDKTTYGNQVEKETTADMIVKINPVTDDINLIFDTATGGTISQTTRENDTFTFTDKIKEGSGEINLKSILSNTSGGIGATPDLDGSEKRTYTISGIPEGTIVKIGDTEAVTDKDGKATLTFKDAQNKLLDPEFTMKFPEHFGGGVKATITLSVYDKGVDSTDIAGAVKTQIVYLNLDVEPVATETTADLNTFQVAQAIGYEDAGRSNGNSATPNSSIDQPQNGIPLNIKVSSTDTDGSEKANVKIENIPTGAVIYYDGAVVTQSPAGTIIINEFDNAKSLVFIPPFNDDSDYKLKVSVQFVDTVTYNDNSTETKTSEWSGTKDIDVIVKNVADAPIGTDIAGTLVGGKTNEYTLTTNATEDTPLNLKSIYTDSTKLASSDNSEELTVRIKFADGSGVVLDENGNPYKIDDGEYVVKVSDIQNDKVNIKFPHNFSGNTSFDLTYVTTEKAGENDSKTWHTDKINIFVKQEVDGKLQTQSTATEDIGDNYIAGIDSHTGKSFYKLDLGVIDNDGDNDEYIDSVTFTVPTSGYELYIVDGTTYTKIDSSNNTIAKENLGKVYVKVSEHFSGDVNIGIYKYVIKDKTNNTLDEITKEVTNENIHTLTINPVTDKPTIGVNSTTTTTSDKVSVSNENKTITVSDNGAEFTVNVNTTSDDKDNSEIVQRIEITGVPKGVEVVGAKFEGYKNGSGVWIITPSGDDSTKIDDNGAFSDIKFIVHNGADFNNRTVTIKTFTKDGTASEENAFVNITLNDSRAYKDGNGTDVLPDFTLTPKETAISEDMENLKVGDLFTVTDATNTNITQDYSWAVTFTDIPAGSEVKGLDGRSVYSYVEGEKTYYVVSGGPNGTSGDIQTELNKVQIILPKDKNSQQVGDLKESFSITGTISTTKDGTSYQSPESKIENRDIIPVTDKMTISITASDIDEDGKTNVSINLSNPSDATKTILGNTITITVTENWNDKSQTSGTVGGELTGTGVVKGTPSIVGDKVTTTYTITKDNGNFELDSEGKLLINGLEYIPATNRDGNVKFEVSVQNKEGSSITLNSKGETTINVNPVIDMVLNSTTVIATGIEDKKIDGINLGNPVKLEIKSEAFVDQSEKFGSIILDEVPNGFTVWYKNDSGTLVMATNIGKSGNGTFDLTPNVSGDTSTHRNKWLIPVVGNSGAMPEIYINAPENWAGDFDFKAQFTLKEQNLTTTEKIVVDITGKIIPVADGVTIDPTLTFGKAFEWVDLKLNANMKDVDGSETMSLELSGLSAGAMFKIGNDVLTSSAVWDDSSSKWTISGIKYDEINKIEFMNDKTVDSVSVKAWTQEIDKDGKSFETDILSDMTAEKTFKADLKDVGGILSLEEKVNLDFSNLSTDSLKGINTIDLSITGENKLENLKLDDILKMTNDKGELTIKGDGSDIVSFKDEANKTWSKNGTETIDSKTFDIYSNSGNSDVKVKVEQSIQEQIIL
ncbi:Calx-beta domain-containing protein [Aliarcobacter vitoriensis]|uniref:Calx-beta domain-containing protein n=1 Tax=Aliarcobacter vitoriensis TaxID=2011099 RepID=A0A366MSY3_9BACT|nr:Calx-beta domain-containing protein [Aliarcobacter vitoriensis]RBQ28730.1 hypothetical protein CRU91_07730 [Aliarcobacter vitoriensis]